MSSQKAAEWIVAGVLIRKCKETMTNLLLTDEMRKAAAKMADELKEKYQKD